MTTKHQPLDDLERFELVMAMFPEELNDEDHDLGDEIEIIIDKFEMDPDSFDDLVGRLVMLAPVLSSPLTGKLHHVLGKVVITGNQQHVTAIVKRNPLQETDHEPLD